MYFVYIVRCDDDTLYTGITTDIERRFGQHSNGKGGRYTRSRRVKDLLYTEQKPNKSSALKREMQIKGLRREEKLKLIRLSKLL